MAAYVCLHRVRGEHQVRAMGGADVAALLFVEKGAAACPSSRILSDVSPA